MWAALVKACALCGMECCVFGCVVVCVCGCAALLFVCVVCERRMEQVVHGQCLFVCVCVLDGVACWCCFVIVCVCWVCFFFLSRCQAAPALCVVLFV